MKISCKILIIILFLLSNMLSAQDEIICFVYHRFGDERYPSTNIQTDVFRKHLQHLKDKGFRITTLSEAITRLKEDRLKEKTAVITVDDGYKTFKTGAMPILEEYGYTATLFINTHTIGGKDHLSWDDIEELQQKGIEIGNHSHSHDYFLNMDKAHRTDEFRKDLRKSQQIIREHTGKTPVVYSYPYGEYDILMRQVVEEEGLLCAAAQNSGVISNHSHMYSLPRFPMNEHYGKLEGFMTKASMHALPVIESMPDNTLFDKNSPVLELILPHEKIKPDRIQCFIDGSRSCIKEIIVRSTETVLRIQSKEPLKDRRTLYTITAPMCEGEGWCWFSHVWINPEVAE